MFRIAYFILIQACNFRNPKIAMFTLLTTMPSAQCTCNCFKKRTGNAWYQLGRNRTAAMETRFYLPLRRLYLGFGNCLSYPSSQDQKTPCTSFPSKMLISEIGHKLTCFYPVPSSKREGRELAVSQRFSYLKTCMEFFWS